MTGYVSFNEFMSSGLSTGSLSPEKKPHGLFVETFRPTYEMEEMRLRTLAAIEARNKQGHTREVNFRKAQNLRKAERLKDDFKRSKKLHDCEEDLQVALTRHEVKNMKAQAAYDDKWRERASVKLSMSAGKQFVDFHNADIFRKERRQWLGNLEEEDVSRYVKDAAQCHDLHRSRVEADDEIAQQCRQHRRMTPGDSKHQARTTFNRQAVRPLSTEVSSSEGQTQVSLSLPGVMSSESMLGSPRMPARSRLWPHAKTPLSARPPERSPAHNAAMTH